MVGFLIFFIGQVIAQLGVAAPDWAMLESLLDDSYEWYIEGHDLPHTLTDIQKFLADMKATPTG